MRSGACPCSVAGPHWRCVWLPSSAKPLTGTFWRGSARAAETAAKEQVALERRHSEAIARIEGVIRSHAGGGAAGAGFTNGDSVAAYLEEAANRAPLLSRKEEVALAKRIEAGGEDGDRARSEMAQANLRLVISIAKKHTHRLAPRSKYSMQFLDLIGEGNVGLMNAVDTFDWRRGYRFSTHATWKIRDAVTRPLKKPEVPTTFFKNVDLLTTDGLPAKKKGVPTYDGADKDDQDFANNASYLRPHKALSEARNRTRAIAESVFSSSDFGYGYSQGVKDYSHSPDLADRAFREAFAQAKGFKESKKAPDFEESEESKQVRQEKADGTYDDDSLMGIKEL
jgi:RNA polymerase sigma factor (sigma-70 family)